MGLRDALRAMKMWGKVKQLVKLAREGNMGKGWNTILLSLLGLVAAALQAKGIAFPQSDQAALATAITSAVMLYQRFATGGPMTWSSSTLPLVLVGILAAIAQGFGVVLEHDQQAALATGIVSILALVQRWRTNTPPLESHPSRGIGAPGYHG